jgi:hypothetical protein
MLKAEMVTFIAEQYVIEGGAWGVKQWTNHFMKYNKAELEILLDGVTNPDPTEARKLATQARELHNRRVDRLNRERNGGRIGRR